MSDLVIIQPQVTELTVTEDINQVVVSSVGVQGPAGATGATGATGAAGSSGVVAVTAPITNSGTSTSANIGVSAGSTSTAGVLQLTDSTSSTSTTTAATPNAVKTAYDLADSKLLKYATPWQVKYRTGYWYEPRNGAQILTSSYSINRLMMISVFIPESITLDRIGIECTSGVASSTFRLGIYNSDSNNVPSTLLLDAGTVSTATAGQYAVTISQTLSAGLYYFAYCQQGGATNAFMRAYHNIIGNWAPVASTSPQQGAYLTGYNQDSVSGALPSTYTANNPNTLQPARIQFRIA